MTNQTLWRFQGGTGPVLAVANHSGHALRPEVARIMALDEASRLREEDPFTDQWADVIPTSLAPTRSRFEVDLNRDRETAIYRRPEDAWGLDLWAEPPSDALVQRSFEEYDAYYARAEEILKDKARRHRRFLVLDLHSYNHRRQGPDGPESDPQGNPEVNVGTGTMDRDRWAPLVDRFIADLSSFKFLGRYLDVRENVKFVGRQFPRWTHQTFPESGCTLAVEFKKFFMDEWTGELDPRQHQAIQQALAATLPGVMKVLVRLGGRP